MKRARSSRHRRWSLIVAIGAVLGVVALGPSPGSAQDTSVFDERGNLVRMPFEPDVPITRTTTRQELDSLSFVSYSSMEYQRCVNHYRLKYDRQDELAPGWTLMGYGFEVATNAYVFTLTYGEQMYRFEIHPDPSGGGSILIVRSRGGAAGYQPFLYSIMPFRASDLGPVPVPLQ